MRRPIVIIIGFIVLVFIVLILLFGLKSPEMPIQEVHKVISMSKIQQQVKTPELPTIPPVSVPTNNIQTTQPATTPQQPIPPLPQQGSPPGGKTLNNAVGNMGQSQAVTPQPTSVPLIVPQPGSVPKQN